MIFHNKALTNPPRLDLNRPQGTGVRYREVLIDNYQVQWGGKAHWPLQNKATLSILFLTLFVYF